MTTFYIREEGEYREADSADVIRRAQHLIRQRFRLGSPVLGEHARTRDFLHVHLAGRDSEVFGILHLNNRDRLIAIEDLFHGTINGAFVHGREVVRAALKHNSARIVCYHNHPSGDVQPSDMDLLTTRQLKTALALIDVTLADRLVVGDGVYSFAEHGLL